MSSRRRCRVLVAAVVSLVGVAAGCGRDSGDDGASVVRDRIVQMGREAERSGRPEQALVLQDGEVSDGEFRRSVLLAVECMEREGLKVSNVARESTLEGYDLTFVASPDGHSAEMVSEISDRCETRFDLAVRAAWSVQYAGVVRADARQMLEDCLRAAGIDARGARTTDEFLSASSERPEVGSRCVAEVTQKLRETD